MRSRAQSLSMATSGNAEHGDTVVLLADEHGRGQRDCARDQLADSWRQNNLTNLEKRERMSINSPCRDVRGGATSCASLAAEVAKWDVAGAAYGRGAGLGLDADADWMQLSLA